MHILNATAPCESALEMSTLLQKTWEMLHNFVDYSL